MTATHVEASERLRQVLDRLVAMSEDDYYNPYQLFQWPDSLPQEQYWMSPELMSTHGVRAADELTEQQLWAISKWESVNFYSLNVHGIRELLTEVISRIYTKGFEDTSEYFHHIIGEENEHMWFFATFCLKYGGKIYPDKGMTLADGEEGDAANFLVFSRLLIFEEIVDFFNKRMGVDERLHPTIRQVNAIHHQDESRHIAFGRQIVALLHERLRDTSTAADLLRLEGYLKRYLRTSLDSLCNPAVYRDAGLPDPYAFRRAVLADPARVELESQILKRTVGFLVSKGIFTDESIPAS
ncbi:diiron oxygenase [Solihabitans fulvus]|uniref:diiron oxygenase n=1 Tax=Solihabitans fulvus TaxID=1892852 RepID=UPI001CB7621B|nr:diiron oxygenase [Solihabitans fulvus]